MFIFSGRDAEEGVAALLRPDGRQRGQDHCGEHPQGVGGPVTCLVILIGQWSEWRLPIGQCCDPIIL